MPCKADYTCIHPLQERRWKKQIHQISEHVEKRIARKKIKDNSINGRRRKIPSEKNGVRQILHSHETQHSSRFDLHELDTEARISQRPDCGKNMPKRKPQVHQIPRHRNRSRRPNGKMAIKKLIATTVSSRETGQKRRDEGKTTSSQMHTATQENQRSDRGTSEGGGRDKLKKVDGDFPACMRHQKKTTTMTTQEKRRSERKRRRKTQTLQRRWRCATVFEKNRRRKQRRQQQQQKEQQRKMIAEAAHWTTWRMEAKAKWQAEAKICAAIPTEKKTMKVGKQKNKDITFIVLQKTWDQCTQVKELKKWYASLKATDGMQYYRAKRGDQTSQKFGRHITNTYSWEQENTITNTVLELCWTRSGGKELLILNTSTNGPSLPRSWQTANASNWWVCTSPLGICGPSRRKNVQNDREAHDKLQKKTYIPIVGGDFNAELGPGHGTECTSVGRHTLNEGNKRGDWMKHWLMLQGYTALNTMYRKTPEKQTTCRSPKSNEKQID